MQFANNLQDVGLLLLRIAFGIVFLVHGVSKLDGKMGRFMLFIGVCETLGGIAVIAGFLTQYAGVGLAIIMLGALYKKIFEWKTPFLSMEKGGWDLDLALLGVALALVLLGAGQYSVDAYLNWWP